MTHGAASLCSALSWVGSYAMFIQRLEAVAQESALQDPILNCTIIATPTSVSHLRLENGFKALRQR